MEELKFDKMKVDTKLAEEFLKENASVINTVKCEDYSKTSIDFNDEIKNLPREEKLLLFANKIEENAELFAQLEALLRDVPKEDVHNIDIKLIVQCFKYLRCIDVTFREASLPFPCIEMAESSPLATLGAVAYEIGSSCNAIIHCCDVTVPICYLFVRLCFEAGIDEVELHHKKEEMAANKNFGNGCSAVVTEHSDMDSAIDMFLYSSSKRPWKLHHLFVQEGEIERFKKNLSAKSKLKGDNIENTGVASNIEIVAYENKLFAFDFITDEIKIEGKQVIIVEAYRTVKELLTLIKKENPFFLSLWTNNISEANEIAYNVMLPIVWINDYGIFDGPDRSSQAFYSGMLSKVRIHCDIDFIMNLENWSKINKKDRMMKIMKVVEVLKAEKNPDVESIALIEDAVTNLESNKFVDIENGRVCVGIEDFEGTVMYLKSNFNMKKVVTALVYGAGCIISFYKIKSKIWKLFREENIPCVEYEPLPIFATNNLQFKRPLPYTRVVYTSFGTMFAN